MDELDEKEFDLLIAEKRHREIIQIMGNILSEVSKDPVIQEKGDTEVNVSVDTSKMEKILEKINTSSDFSSIPNSIKLIGDAIIKKMESNNKSKEWIFKVKRDGQGLMDTIHAKSK